MQLDQLIGGPLTLGILDPHSGLTPRGGPWQTAGKRRKAKGLERKTLYGWSRTVVKGSLVAPCARASRTHDQSNLYQKGRCSMDARTFGANQAADHREKQLSSNEGERVKEERRVLSPIPARPRTPPGVGTPLRASGRSAPPKSRAQPTPPMF